MKLADAFVSRSMNEQAKPLFESALQTLEKAASSGNTNAKVTNELERQQALAKRGLGKFEEAFADLLELLKKSPSAWNIQIDAAETLQRWGVHAKQSDQLARALGGTERFRDPKTKRTKNLVWGWTQLVSAFKSNAEFREPYYRCLLGEVETRYEYGVVSGRMKAIESALKRLQMARNKDQEMGGERWKLKFDELELKIKKSGAGAASKSTKTTNSSS